VNRLDELLGIELPIIQSPMAGLRQSYCVASRRAAPESNCAHCQGDDARGDEGPDLHDLDKSDARIHLVITTGVKGEMPSFGTKLGESDVRALTAYLRTLHG
jgi:mono/diheme cytochrome c family protein